MKNYFTLLVFLFVTTSYAQSFGAYQIDIEGTYSETDHHYEKWVRDEGSAMIEFQQTPMGLKHCRELVQRILSENKMLYKTATSDDSVIGSDVPNKENYEQLNSSIKKGNSELKVIWQRGSKLLQIFAVQDGYQINVIGAFK